MCCLVIYVLAFTLHPINMHNTTVMVVHLIPQKCKLINYSVGQYSIVGKRLAVSWTVGESNAGGGEIFRAHPDGPWGPHSLLYTGY